MKLVKTNLTYIIATLFLVAACASPPSFRTNTAQPAEGTIFIANFVNQAGGGPPDLSQKFTENLKEYYLRNAKKLEQVNRNGEFQLGGEITRYHIEYKAPTNDGTTESAGLTRLNIEVKATYIEPGDKTPNNSFENKTFRFFADFDSDKSLTEVEDELIDEIFEQLIIDIFSACYDNDDW